MKMLKHKKGQLGAIGGVFTGLATIAIVTVVTLLVISKTQSQIGTTEGVDCTIQNSSEAYTSLACNSSTTMQSAVNDAVSFVPLIVIAAIGAVLLGLVALFRTR